MTDYASENEGEVVVDTTSLCGDAVAMVSGRCYEAHPSPEQTEAMFYGHRIMVMTEYGWSGMYGGSHEIRT